VRLPQAPGIRSICSGAAIGARAPCVCASAATAGLPLGVSDQIATSKSNWHRPQGLSLLRGRSPHARGHPPMVHPQAASAYLRLLALHGCHRELSFVLQKGRLHAGPYLACAETRRGLKQAWSYVKTKRSPVNHLTTRLSAPRLGGLPYNSSCKNSSFNLLHKSRAMSKHRVISEIHEYAPGRGRRGSRRERGARSQGRRAGPAIAGASGAGWLGGAVQIQAQYRTTSRRMPRDVHC
jgi:hypothetical protein